MSPARYRSAVSPRHPHLGYWLARNRRALAVRLLRGALRAAWWLLARLGRCLYCGAVGVCLMALLLCIVAAIGV